MNYDDFQLKQPEESPDYCVCSEFVIKSVEGIIQEAIDKKQNRIVINTNLRLGLPMENINKIAGPFVEAWAVETFSQVVEDTQNQFHLIHVEAQPRLSKSDVVLQFKIQRKSDMGITAEVDVKATAEDIQGSGKSPNITSFARIRTAYVEDPDYLFVILSLKHRVYSQKNEKTKLIDGIMEVVAHRSYNLKYLSASDLSYNPALGTGQIQVRDIHYISLENRTTWDFCRLLDKKYLSSSKNSIATWHQLALKHGWIKTDD
jgi:hypothetical protein